MKLEVVYNLIIRKMDHIRQDLDELMGKDRNHPLHVRLRKRDHFDDEQVRNILSLNLLGFYFK
jgi:hypothetical protein